jgi:hypothetical protein
MAGVNIDLRYLIYDLRVVGDARATGVARAVVGSRRRVAWDKAVTCHRSPNGGRVGEIPKSGIQAPKKFQGSIFKWARRSLCGLRLVGQFRQWGKYCTTSPHPSPSRSRGTERGMPGAISYCSMVLWAAPGGGFQAGSTTPTGWRPFFTCYRRLHLRLSTFYPYGISDSQPVNTLTTI